MGIEPTLSAWEAEVLPLYDTRIMGNFIAMLVVLQLFILKVG